MLLSLKALYNKTFADFISEPGHCIIAITSDLRESSFLFKRLSVAIQRFNAVCVYDMSIEQDASAE